MTNIDKAAITARADAATEGPWQCGQPKGLHPWEVCISADVPLVELAHGGQGIADAEFIAHAREDVPALLATIAELERQRDEARAETEWLERRLDGFRKPMGYVVLDMDRASETWSLWSKLLHHTDQAGMVVTNHAGDAGVHACLAACFPVGALDAVGQPRGEAHDQS